MRLHATAVVVQQKGVLIIGASGAGKSMLAAALISQHGGILISDDYTDIEGIVASPPTSIAGLLEVRGVGLVKLPYQSNPLHLVIELTTTEEDRLPVWGSYALSNTVDNATLPKLSLQQHSPLLPLKVVMAVLCANNFIPAA